MVPDGYQISNCKDCTVYIGNFNSDNKSGKGACYDNDGNLIYYGIFSNDRPTDTYPMTKSYPAYKFQTIDYTNGNKYIGETKDGDRAGYGILVWADGDAWLGNWKNGTRAGSGIFLNYNASLWETQDCNGDKCTKYTSSEDQKAAALAAEQQRQYQQQQYQQQQYQQQQQQESSALDLINAGLGLINAVVQTKQGYNSGGGNNYNSNNYNNNSNNYQGSNSYNNNNASSSKKNNYDCGRASKNYDYARSAATSACNRYIEAKVSNISNAGFAKADCDRLTSNAEKVAREAARNGCSL